MTTDPEALTLAVGLATDTITEALDIERARVDRILDAVSVLCADPEDDAMVFDFAEQRAIKMLAQAGLVPTLRHRAAS